MDNTFHALVKGKIITLICLKNKIKNVIENDNEFHIRSHVKRIF